MEKPFISTLCKFEDWENITARRRSVKFKDDYPAKWSEFSWTNRPHELGPDWLWLCNYPGTLMQMYLFNTGSSLKD